MKISKYNISLRLVDEEDADFIVSLRSDEKKSRFISYTDPNIETQKNWIREYKKRENEGKEYYFIASDVNNED